MKINITKILKRCSMLTILSANMAMAVPWCHQGTIVQIADVTWDQSSIIANYPGAVPGDIPPWVVGNVHSHVTHMAMHTYANGFAGGGGGFGGYSVPQSGAVRVVAYAPHSYVAGSGPYNYSQGVQFKLDKCYTIPPMTITHAVAMDVMPSPPDGDTPVIAVRYQPLEALEPLCNYLQIVDPDDDEDYDTDEKRPVITNACR